MPLPPVAARAAPGSQAHDGLRGLQAELAEHPGGVFAVPDLGELAVAGAEDLLPGHGDRPAGGREPEQVEGAYADQGTRDGLLANLAALIDDTTAKLRFGEMIAASYLQGRGPFPERLPLSGLMWRFLWEHHVTVLRWARWARDQVQAWPEDPSQVDPTAEFSRIVSAASNPQAGW
ncbi:MAG TPA: hypothetical protein VMK84_18070 [Streptosporangiaceae bacterium]|nr:hypothetical protein [Streptosporangiaceae bacterium]